MNPIGQMNPEQATRFIMRLLKDLYNEYQPHEPIVIQADALWRQLSNRDLVIVDEATLADGPPSGKL